MNTYRVCLFGHRQLYDLRMIEQRLSLIINNMIQTKPFVEFFLGRNGEFDEFAASVIKRVQREQNEKNSELTLVLPYKVSNINYYEKYYDNIIIPESLYMAHPKAAITLKNHYMIGNSDLVIVYVEKKGGAYSAMKYAEKQCKEIINIALECYQYQ